MRAHARRRPPSRRWLALLLGSALAGSSCEAAGRQDGTGTGTGEAAAEASWSAGDRAAVAAADQAYADAWLANDADAIMATLTDDAILVPSGMAPVEGPAAIRAFWFPPDSPPTVVSTYELVQDEIAGAADLAYVRGSFTLAFDYDGQSYTSEGTYLSILRRDGSGGWRIARRTWNDHRRE